MKDDELIALMPVGKMVRYGRFWWLCAGVVSSPTLEGFPKRERMYLLERDGDVARVPAICIGAVRDRTAEERGKP